MLIKCEHCMENCKDNAGLCDCIAGLPKLEYAYRYRLAEQLHHAVLDRLLDPKNMAKGKFSKDLEWLYNYMRDETHELKMELGFLENKPPNVQRVIEECGDVCCYCAAIIDAVTLKQGGD